MDLGGLWPRTGRFFPDSRRLLVVAGPREGPTRVYATDLDGSKPQPVTPEGFFGLGLSPDGARLLARSSDGKAWIFTLPGSEPTLVEEIAPADFVIGWTTEGRGLFVQRGGAVPARIDRFDLATRRFEPWKEIVPTDTAGVIRISSVFASPDGAFYAYAYSRVLSNLYLVEGLK